MQLLFFAGGNAEGLAACFGELESVFVEEFAEGRHPVIEGDGSSKAKLFVEGTHCLDIEGGHIGSASGLGCQLFCVFTTSQLSSY